MASSPFKNIIIAGATGTIGAPITKTLLSSNLFTISALSRPDSKAILPEGVVSKKANLTSHAELVEALKGQDVLILTLNDAAAELQPGIIEAAYEAGVKRVFPNEWAAHLVVEGTGLVEMIEGKKETLKLLDRKVQEAQSDGKEFHWTGINNGTFFDWALQASFIEITLPPTKTATLWDGGNNITTVTTLSTIAKAVLTALTTAEQASRDKLLTIQSFAVSQRDIIASLERITGEKWAISHTTGAEELKKANALFQSGEYLGAFYGWIKAAILGDGSKLSGWEEGNEVLGVQREELDDVVGRIVGGEEV